MRDLLFDNKKLLVVTTYIVGHVLFFTGQVEGIDEKNGYLVDNK